VEADPAATDVEAWDQSNYVDRIIKQPQLSELLPVVNVKSGLMFRLSPASGVIDNVA
jgi:hypothetical protein